MLKMKQKKAQQLMDIFMEYGWMLLAVIIIIGVIVYYLYASGHSPTSIYEYNNCLGEHFCEDIGGYNLSSVNFDTSNLIICKVSTNNYSTMDLKYYINDKSQLKQQYSNCKNE
jgi:hypothetical protein